MYNGACLMQGLVNVRRECVGVDNVSNANRSDRIVLTAGVCCEWGQDVVSEGDSSEATMWWLIGGRREQEKDGGSREMEVSEGCCEQDQKVASDGSRRCGRGGRM